MRFTTTLAYLGVLSSGTYAIDLDVTNAAIWALASLSAAEANLSGNQDAPGWESLAITAFNELARDWDEKSCGGGLRWQISPFNEGYYYKSALTTGYFFQLSSRLAKFRGNATYSDWAIKSYQWSNGSGLIVNYNVFQGTSVRDCEEIDHNQWSDNAGTYIIGAAYMYNVTDGSSIWKSTLDGLLNKTLTTFFPDGIAKELCEATGCPDSQHIAKGIWIRNLVDTMSVAPYISSVILPVVRTTAVAAGKAYDEKRYAFK
ncbi:hypothetical protein HYFRA_00002052 [Hymenoscyphus fraxineus]|uniref:mannan endo-1,6-alpha-mannosidase n=1 Tax=Hymenoscyphus fraxineus TaxID=746836 RepID=A0A9N9KJU2_9HELO|nr:hypothetical protein HYFRA_00002052 [Hymenoscyphus fraxineus]